MIAFKFYRTPGCDDYFVRSRKMGAYATFQRVKKFGCFYWPVGKPIRDFHTMFYLADPQSPPIDWKEGRRWEESDAYYVQSEDWDQCPFCKSKDIHGASSGPEICKNCGAQWYIALWRLAKKD
jgi:hypothetical protein